MFAVIRLAGHQFMVKAGDKIESNRVTPEKLKAVEVLAIGEGASVEFGQPVVTGAKIELELIEDFKGEKTISARFKAKKHSNSRRGHRQQLTKVLVKSISK